MVEIVSMVENLSAIFIMAQVKDITSDLHVLRRIPGQNYRGTENSFIWPVLQKLRLA